MEASNAVEEDCELLRSLFPAEWMTLAIQSGALEGLRQDKSAEMLLRVLLLHVGAGFSPRETVVRARAAHWAELSDVALLKRLRKSKAWLYQLALLRAVARTGRAPRASRRPGAAASRFDPVARIGPDRQPVASALQLSMAHAGVRLLQTHGTRR
jgi:hypothetical protein